MKSVIRRLTTLTALTATALGASFIASTSSAIAQNYGQQNIDSDNAIAIAEPVSNGRFYRLLVLEQLTNQRACFEEEPGSPTVVEPLLLNFDFSGICGRRTDSNGYSVRIGDEDLSRRYRLQITRRGESLVLVALPGVLPGRGGGDLPVLEIGRSNGVANDFVKIELDPGWQLTRRTLNGNAQGHVYLSNNNSLETVAAQSGNPRPVASQPSPSTPAPSTPRPSTPSPSRPSLPTPPGSSPLPRPGGSPLPSPGAAPSPSTPSGNDQSTFYQVIVPSSSPIVRSRVRQVAPDAFTTNVSGRSVIQAGLFQEQSRANQLVSQLSSQGIDSEIVEGRRAAPPPSSSPSAETYYQVIVPEGGSNTRDRVNAIESGAFRTQVDGRTVIQAGRFREQSRAQELQRRLTNANLPAQIIVGTGIIARTPSPAAPSPSPSIPRARQGQLTVVIDPGHGGRDPGAVGIGGLREKDINISISRQVQSALQAKGVNALLTRSDDREIDLAPRVSFAERADADIFVSIHANAISMSRPDVNGLETFYFSSGLRLAQVIQNNILERTDMRDRGVRRARFYVLVNTSMPAVLVETGFVTGREDAARFRDPAAVADIADGITNGILQYLNVQ
ncbi:MAG: N-acetylmuramoyl-L-alanine amidase [Phormidesmis priestleyi Ana]|uniref:N-acetylmuramoyl-L-alanine amidase n=1 Tax=Phormidesmis priestleyi Ana TaxID=1666911 RepID=A0A0N8KN10_9CYAN|nr:MAG: N-acetylmuramoyl-L-alanine amidase [Phormidesmis priestleyi Ana]